MVRIWVLQRGHSGDGCDLASTLCKYDLRNGDLFVLIWASVRQVRRGSLSSELVMCGGGVRSIFLLPRVARCLETIDVCIWRMFVFMSVIVTVSGGVSGNVCCVAAVVINSVYKPCSFFRSPLCSLKSTVVESMYMYVDWRQEKNTW